MKDISSTGSFIKFYLNNYIYVDKTKYIKDLIKLERVFISRPRRFGKTLNMSMLRSFFEIDADESLFDGLYITKNKENCLFESHKKYIDIQYMFEGDEIMEVENVNNLLIETAYKEVLDYAKHAQSKNASVLKIKENELAIFYPNDAHMPCIKINENKKIIKAVFKILVNS